MIRLFDVFFSSIGLLLGLPILAFIFILGLFDTGYPLFFQARLGRHKKLFILVKFRTMNKGTLSVPSHLASEKSITTLGKFN